ncbi:Cdc6/Cdc18 family protein [Natronocalculus amylovorans]|uniref:AAA family ATPase n=1 Tax=Natronocalculus amylovorans TaxID=2917812 RepID=A0AAE3G0X1_9EURY|nr:AAA family ATPase [Natronocalculus amylovorans]MCL9818315.1 AAA family ATPase [Natronocalculus amylovorans]
MISNARALKEEPLPKELIHRDQQFQHLTTALQPLSEGEVGGNARIFGPSGAGKTTMARMASRELERAFMSIETAYVDCLTDSTTNEVLHAICREVGIDGEFRYRSTPRGKYKHALQRFDRPTVVIVDEADHLSELDVIHVLHEISNLSVIVIANREEQLLCRADDRIASRLKTSVRIELAKYTTAELSDILTARIEHGLSQNIVSDAAVREMATRADGNAREAIWYLQFAAKHCRAGHADRITIDVVDAIAPMARADLVQRIFSKLDRQHRIICEVLYQEGPKLSARALHDGVAAELGEEMSSRTRQRWLDKITGESGYELVVKSGHGPSTTYCLSDRVYELFDRGELP